jgi:hypothetical protein
MKRGIWTTSFLLIFLSITSCKKREDNPCQSVKKPDGSFVFKELVGDTAFVTDTVFRNNYVQLKALDSYESVIWKLGDDPRTFTSPDFTFNFHTAIGSIPIRLTGTNSTNVQCYPGTFTQTKNLTLVEQVQKPYLTISPLVGHYHGYFTDNPTDTFTVRMEYFDSTKYDAGVTGSKNFYWFSNMPNGFTSNLGWSYPELKHGFSVEMGYKCFVFGSGSSSVQGRAWLSHDTLFINYGNDIVGRRKFIGKKL